MQLFKHVIDTEMRKKFGRVCFALHNNISPNCQQTSAADVNTLYEGSLHAHCERRNRERTEIQTRHVEADNGLAWPVAARELLFLPASKTDG